MRGFLQGLIDQGNRVGAQGFAQIVDLLCAYWALTQERRQIKL